MQAGRYQAIYDSEEENWWYRSRRKLINQLIRETTTNKNLNILDIGCGTGRNLMLLKAFGTVYGVDTAKEAVDICKNRKLAHVHHIQDNTYPFLSDYFDVVTCLDVLEHERDQQRMLSEIKRVLKKKGHLMVTVPAYPLLWSNLDTDSHHMRRYFKNDLEEMLKQKEFQIKRISYFNYLLFLPILAVRLFQKTPLGNNTSWGIRPDFESKTLNSLLEPIFTLDIWSLDYFSPPFGVSLFAIAQKMS